MSQTSPVRIVVVDDHPMFRGALVQALSSGTSANGSPFELQEAGNFEELQSILATDVDIDLVLLDLSMPGASGVANLISLRGDHEDVPVIVVSARDDQATVVRSIKLGASGFISKSAGIETVREAIDCVLQGNIWHPDDIDLEADDDETTDILHQISSLTPQQTKVLVMISEGLLNKQIAFELNVSEATVKAHVSAVLQKLDVDSRTQAVIQLNKLGPDAIAAQ